MDTARANLIDAGVESRVTLVSGTLADMPENARFDAALMIGVLHHLPDDESKHDILQQLACGLKLGAPLILAGNYRAYASEPLLMDAWAQRWRMHGADPDEVRAKMERILQGAEPPRSEEAIAALLTETGFDEP